MIDDWRHYDADGNLTQFGIDALLTERARSDARCTLNILAVVEDAYAEDYDRDWAEALFDHDWFCNRCSGHDGRLNERCRKRQGHSGRHDASFNGYMQFVYDERKIQNLTYADNPLLRMVRS